MPIRRSTEDGHRWELRGAWVPAGRRRDALRADMGLATSCRDRRARRIGAMTAAWTDSSHGAAWRLELERDALLPGRLVTGRIEVASRGAFEALALIVALRAEEHWKHEVTTTDAQGHTSTRVVTEREALLTEPEIG